MNLKILITGHRFTISNDFHFERFTDEYHLFHWQGTFGMVGGTLGWQVSR